MIVRLNPATIFNEAKSVISKSTDQIDHLYKGLLAKSSLKEYIELLDHRPALGGYHVISSDIEAFCKDIVTDHGLTGLAEFHKLVISALIVRSQDKIKSMALADDIRDLFFRDFLRISKHLDIHPPELYQHSNDKFSKDLSTCMLRLMPMGAQKIILNGIPRRDVLGSGGLSWVSPVSYILSQLGDFKPLYEMHTDEHDSTLLREFTKEGWDRSYLRIASMLSQNKEVKGVFGMSWFFDPQLERISPKLNFLRERPLSNGGRIFFIAKDKAGVCGALARSSVRQKLFQQGEYIPEIYLMVWPRQHLMRWAEQARIHP